MRYDPRRAQADELELFRSREELARLQAENARLAALAQHASAHTPVGTPVYGRMGAVRVAPARAPRAPQSSQRRNVITALLVVIAFVTGFWYANALSYGAAMRQLQAADGMLPGA